MIPVLDHLAVQAVVAAVNCHIAPLDRLEAIERLRQRASEPFQSVELVPGEEVAVGQPPALQRALQQLYPLLFSRRATSSILIWRNFDSGRTQNTSA